MVGKMTSFTLNVLVAGATAAVLVLPSPSEIRKAIEYSGGDFMVQIVEQQPLDTTVKILSGDRVSRIAVPVEDPDAAKCLMTGTQMPLENIQRCLASLVDQVEEFDDFAMTMAAQGRPVEPIHIVEKTRLSLINLCRASWASQFNFTESLNPSECNRITVGIDY